ncbi:hypothetical protein CEXT_394101 [Caerostris extrusa]|uniref:Uncharacterized protein n=1 Tax=Caerostris extrusa TaxID=172846 RepID=A0AAV4QCR7_CAEEX|nr:hypothetical protein CEXT_394101 [Caerostris extrusa]
MSRDKATVLGYLLKRTFCVQATKVSLMSTSTADVSLGFLVNAVSNIRQQVIQTKKALNVRRQKRAENCNLFLLTPRGQLTYQTKQRSKKGGASESHASLSEKFVTKSSSDKSFLTDHFLLFREED